MNLSKTKYCRGMQCPKMLWMDVNLPEQFDQSTVDETRFTAGNEVGDLAMSYFGDFLEITYSSNYSQMLEKTKELLTSKIPIITEAAFSYQNDLCMVDILRFVDDAYEIYMKKNPLRSIACSLICQIGLILLMYHNKNKYTQPIDSWVLQSHHAWDYLSALLSI